MLSQIESAFQAREASERKLRRFVADASHELRTPLAAVRAYAELFSRGAAHRPDDLERSMAGISRESERMSVLVDELLLLARLDEGRPLAQEELELDDVVAESVETARALEPERAIRSDLEEATVVGDRDALRQVVDNLLANVRAHADPGASVDVTLRRNGANVRLTVADSGPGLTAGTGRACLRALLPRRRLPCPHGRRRGPRPVDRRGGHRRARRPRECGSRARRRRRLHRRASTRAGLVAAAGCLAGAQAHNRRPRIQPL